MTNTITKTIFNMILPAAMITLVALLAGCVTNGEQLSDQTDTGLTKHGMLMVFSEREAGTNEAFRTSMFVNEDILFLTDNRSAEDFILLDRKKKTVYSLNRDDKSIFVMESKPITVKPPIVIDYVEESQPSSAIPKVQGQQALHFRYHANGKHCYDSVNVDKDFMPDVAAAMREFRAILAGEHASTLGAMPAEMYDACDLAVNIFHATKHMEQGIPLREWDQNGFQRFMLDFKLGFQMKKELIQLPEDFSRYSIPAFGAGAEARGV